MQRRGRALDRAVGVVLGIVLGIAVVIAFVFLGSESTIDAPRLSDLQTQPRQGLPRQAGPRIPVVRVIGGAPPAGGPVSLQFERAERVRFRIISDGTVGIEIPGYGIRRSVGSGSVISFRATKVGQFPVIVSASHIGIASLRVTR